MASTTFTDNETIVRAEWLNEVNNLVHTIFGNPTHASQAVTIDGSGNFTFSNDLRVSGILSGDMTLAGADTLDVSLGTLTLANNQISGNAIDGGIISNFASTGIDDNADATAITIDANENVTFSQDVTVQGAFTSLGIDDNADATAITIDVNENVGIGVTPGASRRLHIHATTDAYAHFTSATTGSTASDGMSIGVSSGDAIVWNRENTDLRFATNDTERTRITNDGDFLIGKTASDFTAPGVEVRGTGAIDVTRLGNVLLNLNRRTDDGELIGFYQDGTLEGTISVSGTTISYNGAHLSRWSQLSANDPSLDIPRGTVMTMVDEMCDWDGESNEQLTKSAVSTTPSDPNVAGIFQDYDDSDDLDDFYLAQTGDFIIRVKGNVAMGDLLESAGDGTARPQVDQEFVKRSTIARATKSVTQADDEETLLPCLLMVC